MPVVVIVNACRVHVGPAIIGNPKGAARGTGMGISKGNANGGQSITAFYAMPPG